MTANKQKMGDKHESHIALLLDGRKTKGSGSQWRDPLDGRNNRYEQEFAWAWDCKSTRAKSISIQREVWETTADRAAGERPLVPLRFYHDDRLRGFTDLVVVGLDDFVELIDRIEELEDALRDQA